MGDIKIWVAVSVIQEPILVIFPFFPGSDYLIRDFWCDIDYESHQTSHMHSSFMLKHIIYRPVPVILVSIVICFVNTGSSYKLLHNFDCSD